MRRGVINSSSARRGHFPHLTHVACMDRRPSQSSSVISLCLASASTPLMACLTYGEQSPGTAPTKVGKSKTSPIRLPCYPTAPRQNTGIKRAKAVRGKRENHGRVNSYAWGFHFRLRAAGRSAPLYPVARKAGAVGINTDSPRHLFQNRGCRRASVFGLAPEPRRRLSALEPGSYAPAGSRHRVLYSQSNPAIDLHVFAPFRQAHS